MPAFNAAPFIARAIESCKEQSATNGWELIIVNDGSTDETANVLRNYAHDSRITILHQSNRGISAARNLAIHHGTGDYVAFLDADDFYHKDTIRVFQETIRNTAPDIGFYYCNFYRIGTDLAKPQRIAVASPAPKPAFYQHFLLPNMLPVLPSTALVSREALDRVGLFNEAYPLCEDLDLWTRLAEHYRAAKIDFFSTYRRDHPAQVSKDRHNIHYWRERCNMDFLKRHDFSFFSGSADKNRQSMLAEYFGDKMMAANIPVPFSAHACYSISLRLASRAGVQAKLDSVAGILASCPYQLPDYPY